MTLIGPFSRLTVPRFHRPLAHVEELLGWLWCKIDVITLSVLQKEAQQYLSVSICIFTQCESLTKAKCNTSTQRALSYALCSLN